MLGTFLIVCLAWVFFRAENISHAMNYVIGIFSYPYVDSSLNEILDQAAMPFLLVAMLLTVEWIQRFKQHGLEFTSDMVPAGLRYLTYYGLLAMILIYGESNQDFIYFQF
jgi:glycerol uptake facilitator-like aquaporin